MQKNRLYLHSRLRNNGSYERRKKNREISSVGSERLPYKQDVGGSNPSFPTLIKALQKCEAFFVGKSEDFDVNSSQTLEIIHSEED